MISTLALEPLATSPLFDTAALKTIAVPKRSLASELFLLNEQTLFPADESKVELGTMDPASRTTGLAIVAVVPLMEAE